ncbi:hypothetical protein GGR57DRAFT_455369 [Xylariaceae sp. FL1272]|nr:hypothetical protein GGR57DRAFT_455369 [Xylariaceae sp. FL1272]
MCCGQSKPQWTRAWGMPTLLQFAVFILRAMSAPDIAPSPIVSHEQLSRTNKRRSWDGNLHDNEIDSCIDQVKSTQILN